MTNTAGYTDRFSDGDMELARLVAVEAQRQAVAYRDGLDHRDWADGDLFRQFTAVVESISVIATGPRTVTASVNLNGSSTWGYVASDVLDVDVMALAKDARVPVPPSARDACIDREAPGLYTLSW